MVAIISIRAFLSTIPRWCWEALAAVLALLAVWHWHNVKIRDAVRTAVAADDARYRAAQVAANSAAHATVDRVEKAQSTVTETTNHDTETRLAAVSADYATYRLHHAGHQSTACVAAVPSLPASASGVAGKARSASAQPSADLVAFAEQADLYRAQLIGWQQWYAAQRAVDRTPVTPSPATPPTISGAKP